jgi:hypothetical protein
MPDIHEVIQTICLSLPEAEATTSHGSPDYRVRGKTFATFTVNHHGDGRLALILNASRETQAMYVDAAPKIFFVPPYVGPRGWFGIDLAAGLRWQRVAELVRDAYVRVAPASLADQAVPLAPVPEPDTVDITRIDPFFAPANQALLESLRAICLALPETSEGASFGCPAFKAGKKTFCEFSCRGGLPNALIWVGTDRQAGFMLDPRFEIPAYMGHNGWIRLRFDNRFDPAEVSRLVEDSYRHFALKRMLKALDGAT